MALTIFKSWFVDFEPFGGQMPVDWVKGRADSFFEIAIGKTPPRKEHHWFSSNPSDYIWVSIADMGKSGMFINDSSEYLTAESVERFNIKIIPTGSILLSFKLTVGRVAITNGDMTSNEAIAHFKCRDEITEYLYCYLKLFNYETLGSTSSIATAVNSKTIKAMDVIVPSSHILISFHKLVAPLFKQIRTNSEEITSLSNIRDSLLPKLMSGEITID